MSTEPENKTEKKVDATKAGEGGAAPRPGFDKDGQPYPGVDPKTGERKALTYEGAVKEFGSKRGPEVYRAVALAGGHGLVEGNPPLLIVGLAGEHKSNVETILASAAKE